MKFQSNKPNLWLATKAQALDMFARFSTNGIAWKLHRGFDTANVYRKIQQTNGPSWVHCFYMEKLPDSTWMVQVLDPMYIDTLFEFDLEYFREAWQSRYDTDLSNNQKPRL